MKVIILIILMFLSAKVFSVVFKSPEGKGLVCDIKTIKNDMQKINYDKIFFWFERERFIDFYIEDINSFSNFSTGFKHIKEFNNRWLKYFYNKEFIEYYKAFNNNLKSEVNKIRINRKTLEVEVDQKIYYKRKGKGMMLNNPKHNLTKKLSGKCKIVKSIVEFDKIHKSKKEVINKYYRKNKI